MPQTLTGLFDNYDDARRAAHNLEAAGVPTSDISLVANNVRGDHLLNNPRAAHATGDDAGKGAGIGATIGGVGGVLAGLGLLALPGLGPVVAAGWLVSAAAGVIGGAIVGGAAGGLVGALTHAGVPEEDANMYAEGVRRGGSVVTAKVRDDLIPSARAVLTDESAVDLDGRRHLYHAEGWSRFDPDALDYTPAQIEAERNARRI